MKKFLLAALIVLTAPISLPFLSGMWVTGAFDRE